MRLAARTDANHTTIANVFRDFGASVLSLAAMGNGCPDLLIAYHGTNVLIEIKDGEKSPSRRALTPDQEVFHAHWQGPIAIVTSIDEAVSIMNRLGRKDAV